MAYCDNMTKHKGKMEKLSSNRSDALTPSLSSNISFNRYRRSIRSYFSPSNQKLFGASISIKLVWCALGRTIFFMQNETILMHAKACPNEHIFSEARIDFWKEAPHIGKYLQLPVILSKFQIRHGSNLSKIKIDGNFSLQP